MTVRPGPSADVERPVEARLRELAEDRSHRWFPGLDPAGTPSFELRALRRRPSCSLFVVTATVGGRIERAVVKVRRQAPGAPDQHRPSLVPDALGAGQQTALEHHALHVIEQLVDAADPRLGAVRPLDLLPELDALVLEHVAAPTLRAALLAQSRLGARPRDRSLRSQDTTPWRNAGVWLRTFHTTTAQFSLRPRLGTRDDVLRALDDFGRYLSARAEVAAVRGLVTRAQQQVLDCLAEQLPTAVGHGDYVARNMFVDPAGRVRVFDPLPRWEVPVYDDIGRFLVGLRLVGLQVHSQGLAYPAAAMAARERAFLAGYFDTDEPRPDDVRAVRAYQSLILLDKWAALVSRTARASGARRAAAAVQRASTNRFALREGRRLVAAGGST